MAFHPVMQVNVPPPPKPSPSHRNPPMPNNMPSLNGLSADKALQFTPFTTSVLSVVDRIPIPEVARARENGRIAQSSERKLAQALLQQQNIQPVIAKELAALLNREQLLQIDFRLPPTTPDADSQPTNVADLGLSPLARSVLSMTNLDYRYPTPPTDNDTITVRPSKKAPQPQRIPAPTDSSSPLSRSKPVKNETPQHQPISKPQKPSLIVQVPVLSPAQRREDYVEIQDSPKRRKVSHDGDFSRQSRTQKQQSNETLQSFVDLLNDIFEGQDLVDAAGGDILNPKSALYFDESGNDEDQGLVLNQKTLDKLRDDMRKILNLQRLHDVPVDNLRRLQQLCEPSIERVQSINVRVDVHSDDEAVSLQSNISKANTGICCAIVVIYTMLAHPQKELLLSSDLMRWMATSLVNVLENCIIPTVEARPDATDNQIFVQTAPLSDGIKLLLNSCRRLLDLIAATCIDVKGGDAIVNTIEFLAAKLVFVQNASNEKNSVLGLQVYENLRKTAMASLSKIYARFPRERPAILDEVLSSLDKLPSTSRSARTYRTNDGTSIQLISALFMQLVQTTTMQVSEGKIRSRHQKPRRGNVSASDEEEETLGQDRDREESDDDGEISADEATPLAKLDRKVQQLFDPARKSASDIVLYLVARASKTTKTGDSPYRNILDLLIEDLINVLDKYEWPSAEIMLNVLATRMLQIAINEKAASTKNMALESLGVMGSAITKLRAKLNVELSKFESDGSPAMSELCRLAAVFSETGSIPAADLVALRGPFAMVANRLDNIGVKSTLQQQSARSYIFAVFAHLVSQTLHSQSDKDLNDVVEYVVDVLSEPESAAKNLDLDLPKGIAEIAYLLCVVHLTFCRRLGNVVKALSSSLTSDQAQVKSRSLKSVSSILEIDSSLLDRDPSIAEDVFKCATDDSAMVRDSALSLIARFIIPRGGKLQEKGLNRLLECAGDEKIGVQKRAIVQLKDIYIQEQRSTIRKEILKRFLTQLMDPEESIVSLTKQTLEEVLIKPVVSQIVKDANGAAANVAVEDLAMSLMAATTESSIPMLQQFFAFLLHPEKKANTVTSQLCSRLVQALFEKVISTEKVQPPLVVLTALAEAEPKLVTALQLSKLQVYLSDLQPGSDPFMFRAAVGICRLVLPCLSETHKDLLFDIQNKLMQAISKMGRREELDVIMQCLSTIDAVIHNTDRLIKLSVSVIKQIQTSKMANEPLKKILRIAGAIGKHIDLDGYTQHFAKAFPEFKAKSVSAYFANMLVPLTFPERPVDVRAVALESLGSICQFSPAQFNNPNVRSTFFDILSQPSDTAAPIDARLKAVVLKVFDELYAARAAAKDKFEKSGNGEEQALKQMGGDTKSRDQDSAIQAITMDVVDLTLNISLSEISENALLSARTLASISHQGLIHPKQCLGAFVAFGTSTNQDIATVGHKAQQLLHEQHESHCEREYMSAISQAFKYQANVVESPTGAVQIGQAGFRPKLGQCFDIVTTSNNKYVKKFLSGLVSKLSIDRFISDTAVVLMDHVLFTRFVTQNISFFDYKKLDELLHIILQLELAYSKSGGEIAQAIEAAHLRYPDLTVHEHVPGNPELGLEPTTIAARRTDPALATELKRLGPAAACLTMLIEARSHLLRQYGIGRDVRIAMSNNKQAKETNKSPSKVHGITGERFWTKSNSIVTALEDDNSSIQLCRDFVAAMSMDDDFETTDDQGFAAEIDAEGDGLSASRTNTPGSRKRKRSGTPGTGPSPTKRPRGRPRKSLSRRSASVSSFDDDPAANFE